MQLRLKELREAKGRSQSEVAQCVGVQPAAVSKWENGGNQLKVSDALKIVKYLDCTLNDLVSTEARELSSESRQHQELERLWAKLNPAGKTKLLEHARLLKLDAKNTEG